MPPAPIRVRIWDLWIRLFHWSLVLLLGLSWWSAETGRMDLHLTSGYLILALLLFRLGWGFWGSDTARFARFLRSPLAALRHLGGLFRRHPDTELGHNAAGGWMVLLLLGLIALQVGTGLFSDDMILTAGPLARFAPGAVVDWAVWIHLRNFNLILAAVGLHVLVVLIYQLLLRHDLLPAMLTGRKRLDAVPPEAAGLRFAPAWRAVLLLLLAGGVAWGVSQL